MLSEHYESCRTAVVSDISAATLVPEDSIVVTSMAGGSLIVTFYLKINASHLVPSDVVNSALAGASFSGLTQLYVSDGSAGSGPGFSIIPLAVVSTPRGKSTITNCSDTCIIVIVVVVCVFLVVVWAVLVKVLGQGCFCCRRKDEKIGAIGAAPAFHGTHPHGNEPGNASSVVNVKVMSDDDDANHAYRSSRRTLDHDRHRWEDGTVIPPTFVTVRGRPSRRKKYSPEWDLHGDQQMARHPFRSDDDDRYQNDDRDLLGGDWASSSASSSSSKGSPPPRRAAGGHRQISSATGDKEPFRRAISSERAMRPRKEEVQQQRNSSPRRVSSARSAASTAAVTTWVSSVGGVLPTPSAFEDPRLMPEHRRFTEPFLNPHAREEKALAGGKDMRDDKVDTYTETASRQSPAPGPTVLVVPVGDEFVGFSVDDDEPIDAKGNATNEAEEEQSGIWNAVYDWHASPAAKDPPRSGSVS